MNSSVRQYSLRRFIVCDAWGWGFFVLTVGMSLSCLKRLPPPGEQRDAMEP